MHESITRKLNENEIQFVAESTGTFSIPTSNMCFENVAADSSYCRRMHKLDFNLNLHNSPKM